MSFKLNRNVMNWVRVDFKSKESIKKKKPAIVTCKVISGKNQIYVPVVVVEKLCRSGEASTVFRCDGHLQTSERLLSLGLYNLSNHKTSKQLRRKSEAALFSFFSL